MGKQSFYRWEIYMADCSKFNIENHFVVIVSNFKMNNRGKNVHACLITSKVNSLKSRVDINLYEPSQVACETILTIPKTDLLYKLKDITDVFTQLEIEKNLEIQLQLSSNFINADIEQLENYLIEGVGKMINESQLFDLKNTVCDLALENKYEQAIIACDKLVEMTNASKSENKNNYLWSATYHKSLMLSKLGNNILAIEDARNSLSYVGSLRDGINPRYTYSLWRIANCLENLGDIDGACSTYKSLCKYYKKIGKTAMRITMLFNTCKARRDINRMQILIKMIEKMKFTERETDKNKETLLSEMRQDLSNMQ